ncbi:MAG TPA: HAD-IA family hydrolase [Gammaproteobacteria bacterium]|jgi:phosphoglycolate phosphatase|nr:HAD-IA family hydrolase [Gammaproteobacteria bacterium]
MTTISTVLFDLDGTLVDTAPGLGAALNVLREERGLPVLPLASVREVVSQGVKGLLKVAFDLDKNISNFNELKEKFIAIYRKSLVTENRFFPHIEEVLTHLDEQGIAWGIVTNNLTQTTHALLKAIMLRHQPACIVCGDTLTRAKPHPDTILHACQLLQQNPANCLYVGDAVTDVIASKAANMRAIVALYGYLQSTDDPFSWGADGYINQPLELIEFLR